MWQLYYNSDNFDSPGYQFKKYGFPVRIVKDVTELLDGEFGTYTGNDGTIYETICIGTIEITSRNITETMYRNGTVIPKVASNTEWANLTTGARSVYENNENNK